MLSLFEDPGDSASPGTFITSLDTLLGISYVLAWSYSFYPQLILNYKRKSTKGLSPDLVVINPLSFLAYMIWAYGATYSQTARRQYRSRHDGHDPSVSSFDLLFAAHALGISCVWFVQMWYYNRSCSSASEGRERQALLQNESESESETEPTSKVTQTRSALTPSLLCQIAIFLMVSSATVLGLLVWLGKVELLDWLYYASALKVLISAVKFIPQVILNWRLRTSDGFAIGNAIADFIGGTLSLLQLILESIWIHHDPWNIVGNPSKLCLSLLSFVFDIAFMLQKYYFFRHKREDVNGDE